MIIGPFEESVEVGIGQEGNSCFILTPSLPINILLELLGSIVFGKDVK